MQRSILLLALAAMASAHAAEPQKTRDEMVLDDRKELADNEAWIYNDLSKAFAEAKTTGKPLMVVHRCVP